MADARLEIRVLGPLEVRVDGAVAPIGSRRQQLLLLDLALRRREAVGADRLIDDLWGERPPATARKALQVHVSQLRKLLGRDVLQTRGGGYALKAAELDAERFERLVDQARTAPGPADAAALLGKALALWRGDALGDLALEGFAQAEAARLDEARLEALEARIDADLALGATGLVAELEGLVRTHPLRERLRGQLMLALYRDGRQPEALSAFRDARAALVDELGIEPGPALARLHEAILRQDPSLEPTSRPPPGDADDFVGRDAELAVLAEALDRAIAGAGSVCLVGGEPGVGKTRLAERLAATARARGALVLGGRCWEAGGAPALWPWAEALRAYTRAEGVDAVRAAAGAGAIDLARILPELGDAPAIAAGEDERMRFRLFEGVAALLANAAASRPVVVVIDDLQAADLPSLLLLRFLARELVSSRALVLGTYRDTEAVRGGPLAEAVADVSRTAGSRRIALHGLAEDDVGRLIAGIAGRSPEGLARLVRTETEGNPLFAGELVRLLVAEDTLDAAAGAREWGFGLPDELRDVIGRRLAALGDDTRGVLGGASVLGREFRLDALAALSGLSPDGLADRLDEAAAARVIGPIPGAPETLRFSHALIRDVAYDELKAAERRRAHGAAGAALEAVYRGDTEPHSAELAHHYALAGEAGPAVDWAMRAGRRAIGLVAFEEAQRLFELALSVADDEDARCEALLALGEAEARAGDREAAKGHFREAAELARRLGLPARLARAALGYGGRIVWEVSRDDLFYRQLLEDAIEALGDADDALRARLLAALGGGPLRDASQSAERRDALTHEALAIARRLDDPETLGFVLSGYIAAHHSPAQTELQVELSTELVAVASAHGLVERVVEAHENRAEARLELGDAAGARADVAAMAAAAAELRQPVHDWYVAGVEALYTLFSGDLDDAERRIARAHELGLGVSPWSANVSHGLQLFVLRRLQGRLAEVEPLVRQSVEAYPTYPVFRCALALTAAELGREAEARAGLAALIAEGALPFDEEWLACHAFLTEAAVALGDREHAEVIHARMAPYADRCVVGTPELALGSVHRYLGLLARTLGRPADAAHHLQAGVAADAGWGAKRWAALGREQLAELAAAVGDDQLAEAPEHLVLDHDLGEAQHPGPLDELGPSGRVLT